MNVHKNIQFVIIQEYRKQKISTFKKLDSDNFGNLQESSHKIRAVLNTNGFKSLVKTTNCLITAALVVDEKTFGYVILSFGEHWLNTDIYL